MPQPSFREPRQAGGGGGILKPSESEIENIKALLLIRTEHLNLFFLGMCHRLGLRSASTPATTLKFTHRLVEAKIITCSLAKGATGQRPPLKPAMETLVDWHVLELRCWVYRTRATTEV